MPPTKSNHLYKRLMDWGNRETEMASGAELLKSSHVEKSPTSSQNSINLCFYFSPSIDFLHIFCMTFGYGHKCSSLFVLFVLLLSIVLQIDYFFFALLFVCHGCFCALCAIYTMAMDGLCSVPSGTKPYAIINNRQRVSKHTYIHHYPAIASSTEATKIALGSI